MKRLATRWPLSVGLLIVAGLALWMVRPDVSVDFTSALRVDRAPSIWPDYSDTVFPPNVAPLNFLVDEPGIAWAVRVRPARGETIDICSRSPQIAIPPGQWRQLLATNRGSKLFFDVFTCREDGAWVRFQPIVNTIAKANIDGYLFYRLIKPLFNAYVDVGIYQRDLQSYVETVVVDNRSFRDVCVNCHTFLPGHPDQMIVHIRSTQEPQTRTGMLVAEQGKVTKVDTCERARLAGTNVGRVSDLPATYTAWHPSGRLAAFSVNDLSLFYHSIGETRDVFESAADLAIYHLDSGTVTTTETIARPDRLETFPAWTPDGCHLYFCSANPHPRQEYRQIRCDLMRIRYDVPSGQWGEVEPVLLAEDTGLSITEPRISPDGRWLLFCMSEYGSFPVFQPSSDLYVMDLQTNRYERLAINSPRCESWHCWSSNSRWIAFASKRRDGLLARVYFSYIDEQGHAHKPLLLPQQDPTFYDRFLKTYNAPELSPTPAPTTLPALAKAIRSP